MGGAGPERSIWIDGELVPWRQATVHVLSHSMQRGSLVFDFLGIHETPRGAALFRLREHVERFLRSAQGVGFRVSWSAEMLCAACLLTAATNRAATVVKICAYLPSIEADVVPVDERVAVAIAAYDAERDVAAPAGGAGRRPESARLKLERHRWRVEAHLPTHLKAAANYLGPMMAKWEARRDGYDEIVMVDGRGLLSEGPTSNVFVVDAMGRLLTPPVASVLDGVTRASLLELAAAEALPVAEVDLEPDALYSAEEAFLSGTSAGLWPIASVDDRPLPGGTPGPVTRRLAAGLAAAAAGRNPAFSHWLTYVRS